MGYLELQMYPCEHLYHNKSYNLQVDLSFVNTYSINCVFNDNRD